LPADSSAGNARSSTLTVLCPEWLKWFCGAK
jgi:hypothetical protein